MNRRHLICALGLIPFARLQAQVLGIGNATEWTQILNHAELLLLSSRQIQELNTAINLYLEVVRAGKLLTNMQWSNFGNTLTSIARIVSVGQGVGASLADFDRVWSARFPGHQPTQTPYYQQYERWSQTTLDTIQGAMRAAGMGWNFLQDANARTNWLQTQARTVQGQQQALQLGNVIGIESLNSTKELESIFLADMDAKQAYQAYQVQKDMSNAAFEANFFKSARVVGDGRKF